MTVLALTGIVGNSLFAQTKRGAAIKPKAEKTVETLSSQKFPAMSEAWEKGELPAALPIPAGNSDEAITFLAQKIAAKNNESVPAILTALQMSGFFVTGKDGKVVLSPADGKGQGLTVNGWEIASVAKMLGDGSATTFADLEKTLSYVPQLKNAEISRAIDSGLKTNAVNNNNQFLRNWARLIVELGKNSAQKYDLLTDKFSPETSLDALQNFLILRRVYGDFFAYAEKIKQGTSRGENNQQSAKYINAAYSRKYINAAYSRPLVAERDDSNLIETKGFRSFSKTSITEAPCQLNGDAPLVLDAVATGFGFGFGALTGYLGNALDGTAGGDMLGKYTEIVGIANIILTYAKFLQTYAALETKITLEDAPPLIRTKNSKPGARKRLKADVRMNIGNWQMYNCFRTAINLIGIDFAVAGDGAVGGAGVQWHLDEGGAGDVYSNRGGLTGNEQIVGFTQDGARIQDGGTSTGTTGNRIGNATYTKTGGDGIARIILEGSPQKNAKIGKVSPVMKQAKVSTTVKLKAGDLKSDTVDVAGQALGGITGLITMPLELLYRLDWVSTAFLEVPVQDWEECSGGWSGTITYTKTSSDSTNKTVDRVSGRGKDTRSWEAKRNYSAQFNVRASADGNESSTATASISMSSNSTEKTSSVEMNLCSGKRELQAMRGETSTTSSTIGAAGNQNASIGISTNSDGTYRISIKTFDIKGTASGSFSSSYSGQCYPKPGQNTSMSPTEVAIGGESFSTEMQKMNPSEPGKLSGSFSATNFNVTETLTWDLRKCSSVSMQLKDQRQERNQNLSIAYVELLEIPKVKERLFDVISAGNKRVN